MRRWFLSYNSQDLGLMQSLEAALRNKDPDATIFFAPKSLRAGGLWLPELARAIAEATAFLLLIGEKGLGPWQVIEYYEALDRRVKEHDFPVVLVLLEGQPAPGLPFLRQLHWVITADPASEKSLAQMMDAAAGSGAPPGELWRHTEPYRGLYAMTESDADFFFGRARETAEVIDALAAAPAKLPLLIGNSGVGKSSLAQAGVLAALMRQAWPDPVEAPGTWPAAFAESRRWCFLRLKPGTEPVRALVEPFLSTWQFDTVDPERAELQSRWVTRLLDGKVTLRDLLDATQARYRDDLHQREPPEFLFYIDQGEELFVRAEVRERQRFSEILAQGLADPRLRAMMSMRADFFGDMQKDEPLFAAHRLINVPPLREAQLREVVSKPAALLSARFETPGLADAIARRTAEESAKDAGALPLLSYLLDDMWTQMVQRGDGVLRLPEQAIALGGVLVDRADAFLASHPGSEDALRRIFTLKLATVREGEEPTRRRAARSEFTEDEWRLVNVLADHPNRLLVTATPESGETYAEVAHEAVFKRWETMRDWIAAEREFLAWRSGLEAARRAWQTAPDRSKPKALLGGVPLARAQDWLIKHSEDLPEVDRNFIALSRKAARWQKFRMLALVTTLVTLGMVVGYRYREPISRFVWGQYQWHMVMNPSVLAPEEETKKAATWGPDSHFEECKNGCPVMIVIPAGKFQMGSPENEPDRHTWEGPQHEVKFPRPFAVSKFDVTFDEWDICVAAAACPPAKHRWGRGKMPVVYVSWDDAVKYVRWLSRWTGKEYRLLTEAEWEYAARAGTTARYFWGNDPGSGHANCKGCGGKWDGKQVAPVDSFPPNDWGLNDMEGNVWQWVQDVWHDNYKGAPDNGSKAWVEDGDPSGHVVRGGSWYLTPERIRVTDRNRRSTDSWYDGLGFRVARTLAP